MTFRHFLTQDPVPRDSSGTLMTSTTRKCKYTTTVDRPRREGASGSHIRGAFYNKITPKIQQQIDNGLLDKMRTPMSRRTARPASVTVDSPGPQRALPTASSHSGAAQKRGFLPPTTVGL